MSKKTRRALSNRRRTTASKKLTLVINPAIASALSAALDAEADRFSQSLNGERYADAIELADETIMPLLRLLVEAGYSRA